MREGKLKKFEKFLKDIIALRHNIPQFPLVFIIGIAGNADEFDAVGVGQGSIKIPAVLQNQRLSGGSFFYVQLAARDLPDLFAVQPGGHQTLAGALVQVVHQIGRASCRERV